MPSLWKKQRGNRISRLVADIQTTPKKGESLVVQTGFPTSLVDLFHKNRDKLRKPSKKKYRSKKHTPATTEDRDDHPFPVFPPVSHPHVPVSNLEVPISSSDDDNQQIDNANVGDNDVFGQQTVAQKSYCVELNDNVDFREDECRGVFNSKNFLWLCILMGIFVVGVSVYNNRFLLGITLGALVLLLLEFVGNEVFRLPQGCGSVVLLSILKGALIVLVAMYSKGFVVGITTAAMLLFLFKYVGKLAFRLFKPCGDGIERLRGWARLRARVDDEKHGRGDGKGVLEGIDNESKMVVEKDSGNDVSKSEIEQEIENGVTLMRKIEPEVEHYRTAEEDGNGGSSKGGNEQFNRDIAVVNRTSCVVEEEKQRPICEIEAVEQNYFTWPRQPDVSGPVEDCEMLGKKGKGKKGKKFWKKLVPKKMRKKKNKRGKENHEVPDDCVQENATHVDEADDEDDATNTEESLTISSDDGEAVVTTNTSTATLPADERAYTPAPYNMVCVKDRNLKCLAVMVIPLAGLVRGRMFALILTVICCVVFKMFKTMRC